MADRSDHINVGAKVDNVHVPTKKALRDVMNSNPASVEFYPTSMFGAQKPIKGNELPDNTILQVCGPDPQTSRKWWASVKKGANGAKVE